jgi:hypothetical protein
MQMTWVFGVDSSYDPLTEEEAQQLKDAGVSVYVQALSALPGTGLEQPANRVISLRNAWSVGLSIAGYSLLGRLPRTPKSYMDFARGGVPDDLWQALLFNAVDVETGGIGVDQVASALARVSELLPGKPPVVYTSYNMWSNVMGDPKRPDGAFLWNAVWDANPNFTFPTLRYGGWQDDEVLGEQWSGGTNLLGQQVDRDQFRAEALGIIIPASTPDPVPPPSPPPV